MRPLRITMTAASSLVVVSALIGVAVATRSAGRPPLVLVSGGKVVTDAALAPIPEPAPLHYRLAVPAPDLGSDAPVARLGVPPVDANRVVAMAHAFGLDGVAVATHPGWRVTDGAAQLTLTPVTGGWDVAYAIDGGAGAAGSVPGSTGSGGAPGSSGSGSSVGSGNEVAVPPAAPLPPPLPTETTPQIPARNLPSSARAEQIARALLTKLGVADDSWSATAYDSARDSVVCSAPPCAQPDALLASRTVVLSPTFQSVAVDGISWNVEVGDNSAIDSASGLLTDVRTIARYPLRSVAAVFADLASGVGDSTSAGPVGAREEPGVASPDHVIEPVTVSIDRVTLGYAVVPASSDRGEVLDIVPTYVFTGRTSAGDPITQTMVAVVASAAPPTTSDVVPMTAPTATNSDSAVFVRP